MIEALNIFSMRREVYYNSRLSLISEVKSWIESKYKTKEEVNKTFERKATEGLKKDLEVLDRYSDDIWNYWKLDKILNFRENVSLGYAKNNK